MVFHRQRSIKLLICTTSVSGILLSLCLYGRSVQQPSAACEQLSVEELLASRIKQPPKSCFSLAVEHVFLWRPVLRHIHQSCFIMDCCHCRCDSLLRSCISQASQRSTQPLVYAAECQAVIQKSMGSILSGNMPTFPAFLLGSGKNSCPLCMRLRHFPCQRTPLKSNECLT